MGEYGRFLGFKAARSPLTLPQAFKKLPLADFYLLLDLQAN